MADVFRHMGFEEVRITRRTSDKGRDILMKEHLEGDEPCYVIVECKHTKRVSRPVIQKIHSAVTTYHYDGKKRGIVVTSGKFTNPAREYVEEVNQGTGTKVIQLIDGRDLRNIGDDIGLNLYNGKIEVLCDETLPHPPDLRTVSSKIRQEFMSINAFKQKHYTEPDCSIDFLPTLNISARIDSTFETSVGVIHQINEKDNIVILGKRGSTDLLNQKVARMAQKNLKKSINLEKEKLEEKFHNINVLRFGKTETDYKEEAIDILRKKHETKVTYTGDNNVTYHKECTPKKSDITILNITPVYVPLVKTKTEIKKYSYPFQYLSAHPETVKYGDKIHICVQCGKSNGTTFTYCKNCGSINCPDHTKTERLEQTPICTGCAIREYFFYKEKYFYNEENLKKFRKIYEKMPFYRKALENKTLTAIIIALITIMTIIILSII
ncbi:hypothetical protein AKJ40_02730 [candidate division MSBL1 archaeon SCGC-AAA259M10]|uniref:Restriction endonuclease type IV Mrr domain-containing protein n=1 Tax=candidate division MSBL1 archaeon SCGC-AAA259M10 TaxID=1698270 RepID=A0A133UZN3_9EURY|nr:hypothetical protein AKJ40_02730 [candidate division MSBL1 archaeon SCGC-AAA259M10]